MNACDLNAYLKNNIPLTNALGAHVVLATREKVIVSAPLLPNINHKKTVFGGSLNAVTTLASWCLVFMNIHHKEIEAEIVIVKSQIQYLLPVTSDFEAVAVLEVPDKWDKFFDRLRLIGKSKIAIKAHIGPSVIFEGQFAALRV